MRERCHRVLAARAELENFRVHLGRLDAVADYVIETIRDNYPDLDIPYHARWRHFVFDGIDRWQELARQLNVDTDELARIRFDLVVTSVLLDAGAGPNWRYFDKRTGKHLIRSEGLALASLDGFAAGLFSSSSPNMLTADSAALSAMTREKLGTAFQVLHEIQHTVEQSVAGSQDGDKDQLLAFQNRRGHRCDRRFDLLARQRQITQHFVGEQMADLAQDLTKVGRVRVFVAQQRELVLNKRMVDHGYALRHGAPLLDPSFRKLSHH